MRLAIILVLNGKFRDTFSFLAPVCSSFSWVNLASSGRSFLNPEGITSSASVLRGNKMVARTGMVRVVFAPERCAKRVGRCCLLVALVCCLEGSFAMENPAGSMTALHPRLIQTCRLLRKAGVTASSSNESEFSTFWTCAFFFTKRPLLNLCEIEICRGLQGRL